MQALLVVMMRRNQMNDNIRNMLQYSLIGNEDEFKQAFETEVNDRIADKLAQRHVDITSNILQNEQEQETEEE
jgi:hypothetical protein